MIWIYQWSSAAEQLALAEAHRGLTRELVLFFSVVGFVTCCIVLGVVFASCVGWIINKKEKK